MASFAEELRQAAKDLSHAAKDLSNAGKGGGGGAMSGGAVSFGGAGAGVGAGIGAAAFAGGPMGMALAGGAAALNAVSAGASALTPAASAFAMSGTAQGLASGVTQSLIGAAQGTSVGGLLLGGMGVTGANRTNMSAAERTKQVTGDLAAYGIEVSPEFRQRTFDVAQAQEGRRNAENEKVDAIEAVKQLGESTPEGRAALAEHVAALRRYAEARGPAVLDVLDLAELQAIHATLGEWTS